MFVKAIEIASEYTRPIHSILRNYGSDEIEPGCATLILINDEGYAITCKHVIDGLIAPADKINERYALFCQERDALPQNNKRKKLLASIENRYKYHKGETTVNVKYRFLDILDKMSDFQCLCHPTEDLAIIKFNGFSKIFCNKFPILAKDGEQAKQGKSMCRLGYPYPEFTNYKYNKDTDDIEWTDMGRESSPKFPIDGILTRLVTNDQGATVGIELSTPGLKGQSGGPLFDSNGVLYGMQFQTVTLPLGFDQVDREIKVNGKKKKVNDYSFIHLGRCVHINVIKDFLDQHGVKYNIEP